MPWNLKKSDGTTYGPARIEELQRWAMDGRINPEDMLSEDEATWTPAHENDALGMSWLIDLGESEPYGPIHLRALVEPIHEGDVDPSSTVIDKTTGKKAVLSDALLTSILKENRQLEERTFALTHEFALQQTAHQERTEALIAERDALGARCEEAEGETAQARELGQAQEAEALQQIEALQTQMAETAGEAEARVKTLETSLGLAEENVQRLTERLDQAKVEAEATPAGSIEELEDTIASLKQDLAQRDADLQRRQEEGEKLHGEQEGRITLLREQEDTLRARIESLENEARDLEKDRAQLVALRDDFDKQAKALTQANLQIEELKTGTLSAAPSDDARELMRTADALRKEGAKWRSMYEQESVAYQQARTQMEERVSALRRSEGEARNQMEETQRRVRQLEESYDRLARAAESASPEETVIGAQLRLLMEAHNELSANYDVLLTQLQDKTQSMDQAVAARQLMDERAEQRLRDLEQVVEKEQREADSARTECARIEKAHFQLVRSYREMNDKLIRYRQSHLDASSTTPAPPKDDMRSAPRKRSSSSSKSRSKESKRGRGLRFTR